MLASALRSAFVSVFLLVAAILPGCSCSETETEAACGNGVVEGAETCDDGNTVAGDGCSAQCNLEALCGNNQLDGTEECDDGNLVDGDGCSATCTNESALCGNGSVDEGEQCDDGNTTDGDGCSATCMIEAVCQNGMVEPGEACDDGNDIPWDGCEADCTASPAVHLCKPLDPVASGVCEVEAGNGARLLQGNVLAPYTILQGGDVLVDENGNIACAGCDCSEQGVGATVVRCPDGVISPGLINSHDHITFTHNNPYTDTGERYEHRHDWREGLNGHTEINTSSGGTGDLLVGRVRWGELRFMLGGATSTVGSGAATGFLRNLDRDEQEGLGQPPVTFDTFPLGDSNGTQRDCGCSYPSYTTQMEIAMDDAYFPHVSEGIDAYARNEFLCLGSAAGGGEDLLEPQSAYIHSIGLTPLDYARMRDQGVDLIWSPRSNVTLYGDTAVVTTAARLGVRIALGTDWMPTGSMNLQRELQCADSLNQNYYDGFFEDRELWRMVTLYGAQAAAMDDAIGALQPGLVADIAIFDGSALARVADSYRAIIDAEPNDTALVLRGGKPVYGDAALLGELSTETCDTLDVCGAQKSLCAQSEIGMSFAQLQTAVGTIYPLFFCSQDPTSEPSCKPTRPASVNGSTVYTGDATATDDDGDGLADTEDNCPNVFNPVRPVDDGAQADYDGDGQGDACDPCPMQANTTDCATFDGNDIDQDGFDNASDNCPEVPNPAQDDGDGDNKGDACDPCPGVANPGMQACPASIYDIKQGNVDCGDVAVLNALVTGCSSGRGFYVQVKEGDPGYAGSDYSGVFVYHPAVTCGTTLSVGDRVDLNPAAVVDFFGQIQLNNVGVTVTASGVAPPQPIVVTPSEAGGTVATPLESVVVEVQDVLVTDIAPAPGPGDSAPINEFVVDGVLRVNDFLHLVSPFPGLNTAYTSITGVLDYRNGNSKLEPRSAADLVLGPPVLIGFGPSPSYAREGTANAPTIPDPLTVTLSSPALSNTFVSIGSQSPTNLAVTGGGVTIPQGQTSAPVLVDAFQQTLGATLTATLASATLNATVRVVGPSEVPTVVAITPATSTVGVMGTKALEVLLDIPADNPGGNTVDLSLAPGMYGMVPANVQVPADQIAASFTFSAGTMAGSEVITAFLNSGMASATIDVVQGSGLVINEVDYDLPGSDLDEFVEILNTGSTTANLNGIALVFVNGNNDAEYRRVDLTPAGTLAPGEYLVAGSATLLLTLPMGIKTIALPLAQDNIQNGAPDALCLLDVATSTVIDALSYEGSVTQGIVMGVIAPVNFVEGAPTPAIDSGAGSLVRLPNGSDTDDAATDWSFVGTLTPGTAN